MACTCLNQAGYGIQVIKQAFRIVGIFMAQIIKDYFFDQWQHILMELSKTHKVMKQSFQIYIILKF